MIRAARTALLKTSCSSPNLNVLSSPPTGNHLPFRAFWNLAEVFKTREEAEERPETPTDVTNRCKQLLRSIPQALTIVSAFSREESRPTGLLVSSFNSVTLWPIPYISFNIKVPSSTFQAIESTKLFTASLIDSPHTADVFAHFVSDSQERRQALLHANGQLKAGAGGVIWIKCKWSKRSTVEVGDHKIVVGEVLEAGQYPSANMASDAVVYWQGHYTSVGQHSQRMKSGTVWTGDGSSLPVQPMIRKIQWPPQEK